MQWSSCRRRPCSAQAPSLAQALDRTAGRELAGERELSLFDRVHDEYVYYFTETGQQRRQIQTIIEADEHADADVEGLRAQLAELEGEIERSADLAVDIEKREKARGEALADVSRLDTELRGLEERKAQVERLEMTRKTAQMSESVARKDLERRTSLVTAFNNARKTRRELEQSATAEEPALKEVEERVAHARESLVRVEAQAKTADALQRIRDQDVKYHHAKLDLEQLQERKARIEASQTKAAAARARLERIKITDETFRRIRDLYFALERAQAQLDARCPRISLHALGRVDVEIDGERHTLDEGAEVEQVVSGLTRVRIPDVIEMRIVSGGSVDELVADRDRTRLELDTLLADAVVQDLDKAEAENEARKDALRTVEEAERQIRQDLRDLTFETLDDKIRRLHNWDSYPGERVDLPALVADYDAARTAQRDARTAHELSIADAVAARTALASADVSAQELRQKVRTAHAELQFAARTEGSTGEELDIARSDAPDAELEQLFEAAERRAREAERMHVTELRALEARNGKRLAEQTATARKLEADLAQALQALHRERHSLEGSLETRNRHGLYDAFEDALTRREHTRLQRAGMEQRARAARMLFETMRDRREAAQRSYQGPLRDGILRLGRPVFGESFGIELDDDLRIATRTLDGKTLPFHSLSVGAQEQLALISRVACALVVDEIDGVPLIFDDTLGHSDATRLDGMGAMLGDAGKRCQIIVLTCTPDRYRSVPGAHTVRLEANA